MVRNKVKLSSIIENQIPLFAREDYPFFQEFLKSYYDYLESPGKPADILTNLESYKKIDFVTNYKSSTTLTENLTIFDDTILVESTLGFPKEDGILKINEEIIHYKYKTETSFEECSRGFSEVTGYNDPENPDRMLFEDSFAGEHLIGDSVSNLNSLLLDEFFTKLKIQFCPGFDDVDFVDNLNESLFIKQVKDFYSSKGTDDSFVILFKALYGSSPKIIRPRDFLFTPSKADYRVTLDITVEPIIGEPGQTINRVLYQDSDGDFEKAYGTIVGIKYFTKDGNDYYTLSLDYGYSKDISVEGTVFGEFSIHAQTKTVENISVGASVITVDSTVGFSEDGQLLVIFNADPDLDADDDYMLVEYTSINANQFLGVTGIDREIPEGWTLGVNAYVYSFDDGGEEVRMRVCAVLGELKESIVSPYSEVGDNAVVWHVGKKTDLLHANTWIFNHAISNRVFDLVDNGSLSYTITTYDNCYINRGDNVLLTCEVLNYDGSRETIEKQFECLKGPTPNNSFNIVNDRPITQAFYVKRKTTKIKGTEIIANVQNTYLDRVNSVYVATNSIPNYFNQDLDIKYRDVILKGTFNQETIVYQNHGFYSGDAVIYDSSYSENNNLSLFGIYFVYRIDSDTFKLAKSRSNVYQNRFEYVSGTSEYSKLVKIDFSDEIEKQKELLPQNFIKKIIYEPIKTNTDQIIEPRERLGLFKNGVEILTYKSKDYAYYGEIEEIIIGSEGQDYDVVNPPLLEVFDDTGSGFSGDVIVEGSLRDIYIEDSGFDYIGGEYSVFIEGGNPKSPANAIAEIRSVIHKVFFDTSRIDLNNNIITFQNSSPHKFRNGDRVKYSSEGQSSVGNLLNDTYYYVGVIDRLNISLHENIEEALLIENKIDLSSGGVGNHSLESSSPKNIISKIIIGDVGEGYSNNKAIVTSAGINTANYTLTSKNHQFRENDVVVYTYTDSPISGLSTEKRYLVSVIDEETFRLYEENSDEGGPLKFKNLNQYTIISSTPSGYHTFSYPPITAEIRSNIGVSDNLKSDCIAKLNPIVRGSIKKVEIKEQGKNYGSREILNYEKQPRFYLRTGENALVQPVVFDGKIKDTIILSGGKNYYSTPNIYVFDTQSTEEPNNIIYAKLTPILKDGRIDSIKIIDSGLNHTENAKIVVESQGKGASFIFKIKSWNVNLVDRLFRENKISADDGILDRSKNNDYGLQYTHAYAPRNLRNMVFSQKLDEGILKYQSDLDSDVKSPYHSPILGWAYDGHPIYGPYSYDTPTGGKIRQLKSGYTKVTKPNRPDFPVGFFCEDYEYINSGDLDEHNGRFCITPEYPNGTYAYFLTLESVIQKEGPFNQNKLPEFPYIIGNSFNSIPSPFNKQYEITQGNFEFDTYNCRRNITPYNIKEWYSGYDYLIQPNKFDAHYSTISKIVPSTIDDIEIISEGVDYKVGDYVFFDNVGTGGTGLSARVSRIKGKEVTEIYSEDKFIDGVKVYKSNFTTGLFGVFPEPVDILGNDYIRLIGISTESEFALDSVEKVKIPSPNFILSKNIEDSSITGPVIYINISSGSLDFPIIMENDVLQINSERLKVLNVDKNNSRIRVLREQYNTVGTSHSQSNSISVLPRKFFIDGYQADLNISKIDREFYFDPSESVGIGSVYGPGITTTIYFDNPGIGDTYKNIPTRSIYLSNHGLVNGDVVTYTSNGGDSLVVSSNSVDYFSLQNNSDLYVIRYDENSIGLSTVKVSISSVTDENQYVGFGTSNDGILEFAGIGTGSYHSLKTNYDHVSSEVFQNEVTVITSEDSGLLEGDNINLEITESSEVTYKVFYNDTNRRMCIDRLTIGSIDTTNNQIYIENHGLSDGSKVIYRQNLYKIDGLENDKIYYAVYINRNKIELTSNFIDSQQGEENRINLNSLGDGYFYKINPLLLPIRNNSIKFDLSDSSLSYVDGTNRISAFDFKVFYDSDFRHEYISNKTSGKFNVIKTGVPGIDANASYTILVDEFTPEQLYYALIPRKISGIPEIKSSIFFDDLETSTNNKILFSFLRISTVQNVVSTSSTSFTFKSTEPLPKNYYSQLDSSIRYNTSSLNAKGPVHDIKIDNYGNGYKALVGITSIVSSTGTGARIKTKGSSIGAGKEYTISDVGWDYPTDYTLSPTAKLPDVLEVDQLYSFDRIETTYFGFNYTILPSIIVKDSVTEKVLDDLLITNTKDGVRVIKNTNNLSNDSPIFIPVNNSNGYSIKNIVFDESTKDVVLTFKNSFSDISNFPFLVGDEILIEGCSSVTSGSKGRSFNSSDFNYKLFTITEIDPNIGGSNGTIKFNLKDFVDSDETLGEYDLISSTGIVVLKKFFPEYKAYIKKNSFVNGELIRGLTSGVIAEVQGWDANNEILKVLGPSQFTIGEYIEGKDSGTVAYINNTNINDMYYELTAGVRVVKGWNDEKGFLNNNFQKIQDSFYWQRFSYAIQSEVSENVWEENVERLNHLSGWKRFSDHIIESKDLRDVGITTEQSGGDFVSIANLSREVDINCIFDFDIVVDETTVIGNRRISNGIVFNSRELQDYDNSIGNRVLIIDDISDQFNNTPRSNPFSVIDTFKLSDSRSRKLLIFARDKRFTAERQVYLVTVIHNDQNLYINQYARVETESILGSFDIDVYENEGRLLFYPTKYKVNDYDLSFISYDVKDFVSGVGSTSVGDIVKIDSNFIFNSSGITTTIASIPLEYRSTKLLVQIEDSQNVFEYDEITVLHDGQNVEIIDYGQLSTDSITLESSNGIGTYYAYLSGSNLNVDLIPDYFYDADINVLSVSIASSESGYTNVGVTTFNTAQIRSYYTNIVSSSSTLPSVIAQFENGILNYSGGYFIISIEDKTNQRYQVSEVTLVTDDIDAYYSEFGILYNDSEVGIITAGVNGSYTEIYFTADSSIDAEVRVFGNPIGLVDTFNDNNELSLENSRLFTGYGIYEGTESNIRKDFELFHKGNPIFEKKFDAGDVNIVDIENNIIKLPQHFFVTGERVFYTYGSQNQPIGIATTTISGVGLTDKLPNELYVIKEDNLNVRFAASVEDALNLVPIPLIINSVGFGSDQYITAQKQNTKALITIDNMIQSPIVSTAVTASLQKDLLTTEDVIVLNEKSNFLFGGDLIKINDEIMRISIVGYGGSENAIYVQRPWLGTYLSTHSQNDLITKVIGNYNIVNNTISFAEAPYGKFPLGLPENPPDERDYTGITTYSTFSGRTFMRSGFIDSNIEPYSTNIIFDGIQDQFTGFTSYFDLKVNGQNITGIKTSNAIITLNDIFQSPKVYGNVVDIEGNYYFEEDEVLEKTTIYFDDNEYSGTDSSVRGLPIGGKIISVGSEKGFGYQPLISAGGTAIVSSSGSIESIFVSNVGSGYRSGIQTVYVGVQTSTNVSTGITTCVGIASISNGRIESVQIINPGSGYTHTNPPLVIFDAPLSYTNIPLQYSSSSIGNAIGVNATIDMVVGQDSRINDFDIVNSGLSYEINNVLTVSIGGSTGIPREYRGRFIDGANLLSVNKEFISNEVVGFVTTTYPSVIFDPDFNVDTCRDNIEYVVDSIAKDLAFGGNINSIQSGLSYWYSGISFAGEFAETMSAYEYIAGISSYIINNISLPISYQVAISSVTQVKDVSIDYDETCSPLAYSSNCCSDVISAISNYVGIITTIVGFGTQTAPREVSPYSQPTLSLPTTQKFEEFKVIVNSTYNNEFTGWTIGDLQMIDDISDLFDGFKTKFPIKFDGIRKSIKSATGSLIDIQATLLVFINDILQVPGQGYIFKGGSVIRFSEAPKPQDRCKILFYRGTGSIDVEEVDILETVSPGDVLTIHSDTLGLSQDERSVKEVTSTDSVETFPYGGIGISDNEFLERPVNWCKGNVDLVVDGLEITKDRELYEAQINPFTNLIYDVGVGSSIFYVESVKTFFDNKKENATDKYISSVDLISQDITEECIAVANVNSVGIVTTITIINEGYGYKNPPTVSISNPLVGTDKATATSSITFGKVTSIIVDNGGSGYDQTKPPSVLVSPPLPKSEVAFKVNYEGDFGLITGIGTTSVGVSSVGLVLEFSIPEDSPLKNESIVEKSLNYSGIGTGDFFILKDTSIGYGVTSVEINGNKLASGYDYLNNVYQVHDIITDLPYVVFSDDYIGSLTRYGSYSVGIGASTTVAEGASLIIEDFTKVVTVVEDISTIGITSFLTRSFYGEYSYGKITNANRPYPEEYNIYRDNGLVGIQTSPIIRRTNALKSRNYLS